MQAFKTYKCIRPLQSFTLPNTDIDECTEDIDDCAHTCINTVGSYICSCDSGYRLSSNNRGCYGKV